MPLTKLYQYIFVTLILGLLTTYVVRNQLLGLLIVFFPLIFVFRKVYKSSEDKLDFLLYILFLSHFTSYMPNQGGLWILMTMVIFILNLKNILLRFTRLDLFQRFLIIALFLYNSLGLLFVNKMEIYQLFQYFLIFTDLLFIFVLASTVKFTKESLIKLFKVCFAIAILRSCQKACQFTGESINVFSPSSVFVFLPILPAWVDCVK